MPPKRTPLSPSDGNVPYKGPLSEFERGQIIGMSDGGQKRL
jgi:hypothetical protein